MHACGHSAGAIFHAFFLPALVKAGASVQSLALLAPAVNVPTFKSTLVPLAGKGLGPTTMFTMRREFERADTAGPYPHSLLYLVHHSFEDPDQTPILGLEENLTADAELSKFFASGSNEIVFSVTAPSAPKRASTRAVHHGDFDNDAPTMNSVCRRMLGVDDATPIADFPEARGRALDPLEGLNQELIMTAQQSGSEPSAPSSRTTPGTGFGRANAGGGPKASVPKTGPAVSTGSGGRRLALCIGIDAYAAPNTLQGCVNDSQEWEGLFRGMNCTVTALRNEAATRATITKTLSDHVSQLKARDVFLFQYAGHGTQFDDDTGDEPDGKDEALCPVDMMTAGFIRDDEIRAILNRVPAGALAIGFMDCCHSGSITRMMRDLKIGDANNKRPRAIDPTPEMIAVHRRTRKGGRTLAPQTRRDILFAACRDDQVAFETGGHGDYTKLAVPIFGQPGNGLTNLAVQKLIQKAFGKAFGAGTRQNPMLDCDAAAESDVFLQP